MDIELSVDIVHVRVYGSDGDDQIASDIAHGTVMGKHDDDLVLAWGESIGCGNGVAALANTFVVNKLCMFFGRGPKGCQTFSVIDHPEGDQIMEVTTTRAIIENKSGDGLTIMQMAFPANAPSARPMQLLAMPWARSERAGIWTRRMI